MKISRNFKSKLLVVLGLVAIMFSELNLFVVNAGRENLTYKAQTYRRAIWDTKNQEYHGYALSTVGGNQAYCMDYGLKNPASGITMQYLTTYNSNKLNAVLNYGYPNHSPSQLGLSANDIESAYLGTQLAVWVTMNGNSKGKVIDLNSLQPNVNTANNGSANYKTILENAKKVANKILANATYAPSFSVSTGKVDYTSNSGKIKVGPFKVNAKDYEYTRIEASLTGKVPEGTVLVDSQNNVRTSFVKGEDIYVLVNNTADPAKITLNVSAVVNETIAVVYGNGDSKYQRFIYPSIEQKTVKASTDFTWEKQEGNVVIDKYDQDGNKIEGVTFELYKLVDDENGIKVDTKVTDKNGKITFSNLPVGSYKLVETKVPDNYVMPKNPETFIRVEAGKTNVVQIENRKLKGGLEVLKIDEDTKKPIEGAVFQVYETRDGEAYAYEQIVSGKDGKAATTKEYKAGRYYFKEISAPEGYKKDENMYNFDISSTNLIQKATVTNKRITGSLEITKVDNYNKKIEGAKFAIINVKTGKEVEVITTGKDGKAVSSKLPVGEYKFKEVSVPDGYVLDTTDHPFSITSLDQKVEKTITNQKIEGKLEITKFDDTRLNIKGVKFNILASDCKTVIETLVTDERGMAETKLLPKGEYFYQEIEVPDGYVMDEEPLPFKINEAGQVVKAEVVNERVKGSLEILKIDEDTKAPIEGVKFQILDSKKNVVKEVVTDKNGIARVDNLVKGKYYYKEVEAPDKYEMKSKAIAFKIEEHNQVVKVEVTNKLITGGIQITKVDDANKPIANVVFEIKNEAGEVVDTITTNEKGIATSKALEKGVYSYQEVSVPDGYIMDNSVVNFKIESVNQILKAKVTNDRIKGYIEILKVDDENQPIKGVKFEILNAEGKVVDTMTTDSEGRAVSKSLLVGKYSYREVKAPNAYVIDTNTYDFDITSANTQIQKTVVNKKATASLKIVKIDKDTKAPIEGVTFQILDENKKVVDTIVTDANGIAQTKQLILGKYYYKEIAAPDKYIVDSKEQSFKLDENAQVLEKQVTNKAKELPVTGGGISLNTLIVLIVAALSVSGYLTLKIVKDTKRFRTND